MQLLGLQNCAIRGKRIMMIKQYVKGLIFFCHNRKNIYSYLLWAEFTWYQFLTLLFPSLLVGDLFDIVEAKHKHKASGWGENQRGRGRWKFCRMSLPGVFHQTPVSPSCQRLSGRWRRAWTSTAHQDGQSLRGSLLLAVHSRAGEQEQAEDQGCATDCSHDIPEVPLFHAPRHFILKQHLETGEWTRSPWVEPV